MPASGMDSASSAESSSSEPELAAVLARHRPAASHLQVLDLTLEDAASRAYLAVGARVVGLGSSTTVDGLEGARHYFRLVSRSSGGPWLPDGSVPGGWDMVIAGAETPPDTMPQLRAALAPGGVLAWIAEPGQTVDHAEWMRRSSLTVLFQGRCRPRRPAASDSARLLTVGLDPRPAPTLGGALARIDRTACVDRPRLLTLASEPLWRAPRAPTPRTRDEELIESLERQVARGHVDMKTLAWPSPEPATGPCDVAPGCDVLAVFAHPDDESIYAGESISALTRTGRRVHLLVVTDGAGGRGHGSDAATGLAARRRRELGAAASRLGIARVEVLAFADFGKHRDEARTQPVTAADTLARWGVRPLVAAIVERLRRDRPRAVLTFECSRDPNYSLHGHHLAVGIATTVAVRTWDPAGSVAQWGAIAPEDAAGDDDVVGPLGDARDLAAKREAVTAHASQSFSSARLVRALDRGAATVEAWHLVQGRPGADPGDDGCRRLAGIPSWSRATAFARGGIVDRWLRADPTPAEWLGSPPSAAQWDEDTGTSVVTGQQVGLFGGPALTLHKALAAVSVARRWGGRASFWMATQDHDLDEVGGMWIDHPGGWRRLRWSAAPDGRPVGQRRLDERAVAVRDEVVATLRAHPHVGELDRLLRAHYVVGATLAEAFAGLLGELVGDQLILVDPTSGSYVEAAAPLFARLVETPADVLAVLADRGEALRKAGHAVPVDRDPARLPVFVADEQGRRRPLSWTADGGFAWGGGSVSPRWLSKRLLRDAGSFTPDVLLRPVVQDMLLESGHYIAGPNELAYWAQATALHDWAGLQPARLLPRPRLCVVRPEQAKAWSEVFEGLPATLGFDAGIDVARHVAGLGPLATVRRQLGELRQQLLAIGDLEPAQLRSLAVVAARIETELTAEVDRLGLPMRDGSCRASVSLEAVARAQAEARPGAPASRRELGRAIRSIRRMESAVSRAQRDAHRPALEARRVARPRGSDQDRVLSVAELVARFGPTLGADLLTELKVWREDAWPRGWVVPLTEGGAR